MIERVLIDIIGRDKASRAFDTAAASAAASAKKMDASLAAITRVGATLTKRLTVPIVAVGAASVDMAMKWQKSQTLLQTAGGETLKKMQVIGPGIQKIAVSTGTSLTDLSDGMYTVAKAGAHKWSATGQLKVLQAAAQGAKAEQVDLGTATSALTSVMQSYGMHAAGAVKAEDMLIRGSGLAKTTFQEFSSSLSNVVPLAAALKISFPQVAGSIATMTQHGESAANATQNLNNLLTNLAGQNNVASKTMQQLGINTLKLRKNLGKEGISGALNMVEQKLAKNSKGGMIVVSAFKKAQLATGSLNTMLGTFTGTVKSNSEALLAGKMGYTDYYKYAKSLGGQVGAGAIQFAALYKSAYGFNDALRAGNGDVQTATTMLQKMLGGMTGMRAALMLTGKSAKQNASNIDLVAQAAQRAGVDVLGWSKTSGTLSVKLGQAKANLQVLGVEIGTALIPFVTTLTQKISGAVTWFENLPPAMKQIIGYSALTLAALGPVLSIIGNVGKAVKYLWLTMSGGVKAVANFAAGMRLAEVSTARYSTTAYSAGFRVRAAMSTMSTSAKLAATTLGAGALGLGIGLMTRHASTGAKALGLLGSAALGAVIGFRVGGPWGAAVGGAAGAIGDLVGAWGNEDKAAQNAAAEGKAALKAQQAAAANLLSTLHSVNGAYNKQVRDAAVNQLDKTGALKVASQAGLTLQQLHALATKTLQGTASTWITDLWNSGKWKGTDAQLQSLLGQIDNIEVGTRGAERAWERYSAAQQGGVVSSRQLAGGLKNLRKELKGTGTQLQWMQHTQVYNKTLGKMMPGVVPQHFNSAEAARNTEVLKENLRQLRDQATAEAASGKAISKVRSDYEASTRALTSHFVALGFTRKAVANLVKYYGSWPKAVATEVKVKHATADAAIQSLQTEIDRVRQNKVPGLSADSAAGQRTISALQAKIDAIRQGKVPHLSADASKGSLVAAGLQKVIDAIRQHKVPGVTVNTGTGAALLAEMQSEIDAMHGKSITVTVNTRNNLQGTYSQQVPTHKATGGAAVGPGTKTSDSIPARLSNGEHVWTADEVEKAGGQGAMYRARGMVRAGVLRFAKGGAVPGIKHVGGSWIYGGIRYASERAALNARTRDRQSAHKPDTSAIGSAIGRIGSSYSKPIDVASVGIARIEAQIAHARKVLDAQIAKGLGGKATAKFRAEIKSLSSEAAHQLERLKVKIKHADVSALTRALHGSVSGARTAFATLLSDARAAGVSRSELERIGDMQGRILGKMRALGGVNARLGSAPSRPTAYDRLATAKGNYSGERGAVRSSVLGAFDITTAGAGTQVYNDRAAAPTTGKSILAALKVTVAKAKKFAAALGKLKKMGLPATLLSQLAQAGPDALDQAKALISSGAGTIGQISTQYKALQSYAGKAGTTSADAMYGAGVKSAQKLVDGLLSRRKALQKAMRVLERDMTHGLDKALRAHEHTRKGVRRGHPANGNHNGHPHKQHHQHRERPNVHVDKIEIHEQRDPVAAANAVTRRLAHLGAA